MLVGLNQIKLLAVLTLCFSSVAALSSPATSNEKWGHLGTIGPVYPIHEEDFIEYIERKLKGLQKSGEWEKISKKMRVEADQKLSNPPPATGLRTTTKPRSYYFDPTITIQENIVTPDGHLLAVKGQRINPLDTISWGKAMLFIDARDPLQRALANQYIKSRGVNLKVVLVAGNFQPLSKTWKMPVFYDQGGKLTNQFGIQQVPALVYQQGKQLRVDEIVAN